MGIRRIDGSYPFGSLDLRYANGIMPNASGGFSPLELEPALWLDASDAATLYDATSGGSLVAPDGTVARWEDKSGQGNHATQGTSAARPLRRVGAQNGLDVVEFDASNDGMATALVLSSGSFEIFTVYAYTSASSSARRVIAGSPSTGQNNWLLGPYSNQHVSFAGISFSSGPSVYSGVFVSHGARQTSESAINRVNGTDYSGITVATWPGLFSFAAYGVYNEPAQSKLAEVIVFTRILESEERMDVEDYLMTKWGIAL